MRTAIIISDGIKQINFIPETDGERLALSLISVDDNIQVAVKKGSFGDKHDKPYTVDIASCQGGFLRAFSADEGVMLVLSPKVKEE